MKWNLARLLAVSLCLLCLSGATGPSCGYGEPVVSDTNFDKTLANPTMVIEPLDGEATITWDAVATATSYNIYIETTSSNLGKTTKRSNVQSPQKIGLGVKLIVLSEMTLSLLSAPIDWTVT